MKSQKTPPSRLPRLRGESPGPPRRAKSSAPEAAEEGPGAMLEGEPWEARKSRPRPQPRPTTPPLPQRLKRQSGSPLPSEAGREIGKVLEPEKGANVGRRHGSIASKRGTRSAKRVSPQLCR